MNLITQREGLLLLGAFGAAMVVLVWFKTREEHRLEGFLVAGRDVPLWHAALSIAVSWVWAPAVFVCSLQAYDKGVPGVFWFTAPNVLCFFVFAPLAVRFRRLAPCGYTLPELIVARFAGHPATHIAYLVVFLGYQLGAIVINCLAGGMLLSAVAGLDLQLAIVSMAAIALAYSLLGGLRASVFTDVVQMAMVLGIAFILVPWCTAEAGGLSAIRRGLGGFDGTHASLFDPHVAFAMGIPMTLGLIAGPIGDQMFFQRALAVRTKDIVRVFVYGGLVFALVPLTLSLLGFIGATLARDGRIHVDNAQVVGAVVVAHLLPKAGLDAFCMMAFAGLCSTLDSAFCAVSALGSVDIYKRYIEPGAGERSFLMASRVAMSVLALAGTAIALLGAKLLWVFLVYGALASAGLFPTIFALVWGRVTARGAFWGVTLSLLVGTPLSIYANVKEQPDLIVASAVLSVAIGLVTCVASALFNSERPFDYAALASRVPAEPAAAR